MADNNINPGDQRYNDLYSNQGRVTNAEELAANNYERDYSTPTDHSTTSSLNDWENRAVQNQNASQPNFDNGAVAAENQASHQTVGFDGGMSGANPKQKTRMRGFKRKLVTTGLVFFAGAGVLGAGFAALSGPMQFVQAAEMIKDFQLFNSDAQKTTRSMSVNRSIARLANGASDSEYTYVQKSRLGIVGQRQAKAMTDRLGKKGVSFDTSGSGYAKGLSIDLETYSGQTGLDALDIDKLGKQIAADMDLPSDKFRISGNKLVIDGNISYSQARRTIKVLDDPGKWSLSSWMQSRSTLKGMGYTSWLHPLEKAKTKAYKTIDDFIDGVLSTVDNKLNSSSEISKNQETDMDDIDDADIGDIDSDDLNTTTSNRVNDIVTAADNTYRKKGVRTVLSSASDIYKNAQSRFNAYTGKLQGPLFVIGIICLLKGFADMNGPYKMANVVNVAIKGTSNILGLGSQIQSGDDITLDAVGLATKTMMYDEVQEIDADGNSTGQTKQSSFWDAEPVCKTLGQTNCINNDSETPGALLTVSNSTFFPGELGAFIDSILTSPGADLTCLAFGLADAALSLVDFVGTIMLEVVGAVFAQTGIATQFMNQAINIFLGKALDITSATPRAWGSIAMFGGKFMANSQAINSGGKKLTSKQALELNLENRRYLAWENNRKPLLARIADPADYNSSINQIARAAKLNTSNQNFTTQLANVVKTFTAAPTILATASNQLFGGSAYAAASSYDYGVSDYGWDLQEMNDLTGDSEEYDVFQNANDVIGMLAEEMKFTNISDSTPYRKYAKDCLNVDIDNTYSVKSLETTTNDATAWNYTIAEDDTSRCNTDANYTNYRKLRLYVMDYTNILTSVCYNGSADDVEANSACKELGVDTDSMGNGAINTTGNQPAEMWQQSFVKDTNDTGVYDGYSSTSNGCTTISAWFIGAHTTLTYGHGHGKDVVKNLKAANPNLEVTDRPTKAPALFSSTAPGMNASDAIFGHVGLVTAIDEDGTIHTLESGATYVIETLGRSSPWSWVDTHTPSDYASNTSFVYLGDYLK